jgi:predicted DNA-binding transcriptional regulator AlpA
VIERLLTARHLAGQLGVSTGALLRWTRDGKIPGALKLPSGAVRYRPELIALWLDDLAKAGDATEEVSPAPDATRQDGTLTGSPVPLRRNAARTEEEPHGR